MIWLHGGVICPAEIAALLASWPFLSAVWFWLTCRIAWITKRARAQREHDHNEQVMDSEQFSHWRDNQ